MALSKDWREFLELLNPAESAQGLGADNSRVG